MCEYNLLSLKIKSIQKWSGWNIFEFDFLAVEATRHLQSGPKVPLSKALNPPKCSNRALRWGGDSFRVSPCPALFSWPCEGNGGQEKKGSKAVRHFNNHNATQLGTAKMHRVQSDAQWGRGGTPAVMQLLPSPTEAKTIPRVQLTVVSWIREQISTLMFLQTNHKLRYFNKDLISNKMMVTFTFQWLTH